MNNIKRKFSYIYKAIEEAREGQLQMLTETLRGLQKFKTEQISPDLNNNAKKKPKPKIINIKSLKKVEFEGADLLHNRWLLDEFDRLFEKEIPDYRKISFDRITPNLILKFSKGFDQIINHSISHHNAEWSDADGQNSRIQDSVFYYIKNAYESFIKRIVGISELSETENILKKCLELSSPKFSTIQTEDNNDNSKSKRVVKSYSVLIEEYKELFESNSSLVKEFKNLKIKMENDIKEFSKRKTDQLKKMKAIIRQLKIKLEEVTKTEVSSTKYNKLKENFKVLAEENEQLNHTAWKLRDLVDDLNQKKNKLNFLIFLWMKEGYPVNRIYKTEVQPIDSHRFDMLTPSKIKNSIKKMNENNFKSK